MRPVLSLEWPDLPDAMARMQTELAALVRLRPAPDGLGLVAGLAVAAPRRAGLARAAVAILRPRRTEPMLVAGAQREAAIGYRPGSLAFAVGPAAVAALQALDAQPDLLFVQGHGLAHPRRCGLASHLGVLFDLPTIGCADRLLAGEAASPGPGRGDWEPVSLQGENVGALLRTRERVRPVCVSPGHLVTLPDAIRATLAWARYRWPEPLRLARQALRRGNR